MNNKVSIENRKAHYDYFIEDTIEAGISLIGNEVKSIREGSASIKEAWVAIDGNEAYIKQMFVNSFEKANRFDLCDEKRDRKLLLHKAEIKKLQIRIDRDGYTLVPLKVYFTDTGKCKVLVGVCRGKKNYDKRETIKKRDVEREIRRSVKR